MKNYRVEDVRFNDCKADTDIRSNEVTIYIRSEMPIQLRNIVESMMNGIIESYNKEHNTELDIDSLGQEISLAVDMERKALSVTTILGSEAVDLLVESRIITSKDSEFGIIKNFFMQKLTEYVADVIRQIGECIV